VTPQNLVKPGKKVYIWKIWLTLGIMVCYWKKDHTYSNKKGQTWFTLVINTWTKKSWINGSHLENKKKQPSHLEKDHSWENGKKRVTLAKKRVTLGKKEITPRETDCDRRLHFEKSLALGKKRSYLDKRTTLGKIGQTWKKFTL